MLTTDLTELEGAQLRERLAADLIRARERTKLLTAVDDTELLHQHSPLMSPLVWDLAHIGNQEELWLLRDVAGRDPLLPETVDQLYDAFQHPRNTRPSLPLLEPVPSRRYVDDVRGKVLDVLERIPLHGRPLLDKGFVFGMIVQHEQQHDETMLATHQLRTGEALLTAGPAPRVADGADLPREILLPGGRFTMGSDIEPWALDNERPTHGVDVPSFFIDTTPVTNADYLAFVEDGGYADPRWWHPQGWQHVREAGLVAPQFWVREGKSWFRNVFGRTEPLRPQQAVVHVNWYEADAYARWAGRRLPTEAEWEKAARFDPESGRSRRYPWGDGDPTPEHANLGQRHLEPSDAGAYPAGSSALGVQQLIGDVWEWTSSLFDGYPGFRAWPYREYSEVFFGGGYRVLRGGSFGTDPAALRSTFRNWDHPIRRQIFSGFRCARPLTATELSAGL